MQEFEAEDYYRQIDPWISQDQEDQGPFELPQEGVGCWNPIFPARHDDISVMASMALKELAWRFERRRFSREISVWEQERDSQDFPLGVRKRTYQDLP